MLDFNVDYFSCINSDPHRLILAMGYGAPPQASALRRIAPPGSRASLGTFWSLRRPGENESWSELLRPCQLVENISPDLSEHCLQCVKCGRLFFMKIVVIVPPNADFRLKCIKFQIECYKVPLCHRVDGRERHL